MRKLILILVVVLLAPAKIFAQDSSPENNKPIKISRIKSPIILDGLSNKADRRVKAFRLPMWNIAWVRWCKHFKKNKQSN